MESQATRDRPDNSGLDYLPLDSECARLVHDTPWEETPLGHPSRWSLSLRMMVRQLLANRFPLLLWWGPDYGRGGGGAGGRGRGAGRPGRAGGGPGGGGGREVY